VTPADFKKMTALERKAFLDELCAMVAAGDLRLGEAARILRRSVLGMDQVTFGRTVHLSDKAIRQLEEDPDSNPTLETLTRIFAPFGGKISLVFPRMQQAPPAGDERSRSREAIREALAKTRRRRPLARKKEPRHPSG
jgi:DNA-binding XRE family transcriptional regulator